MDGYFHQNPAILTTHARVLPVVVVDPQDLQWEDEAEELAEIQYDKDGYGHEAKQSECCGEQQLCSGIRLDCPCHCLLLPVVQPALTHRHGGVQHTVAMADGLFHGTTSHSTCLPHCVSGLWTFEVSCVDARCVS